MCADAGHIAQSLWFALGVFLTIRFSRVCVAPFIFAAGMATISLAMTASGDLAQCLSQGEGSELVGPFGTLLFAASLDATIAGLVSGVLASLVLLTLVWVAQLQVSVLAQLLLPNISGKSQQDLQQRLHQLMTLYALIISFGSGFAEQMLQIVRLGRTADSFGTLLPLGAAGLKLATQGVLLIILPLLVVLVVLNLSAIFAERLLQGRNVASVILLARAPLVLIVFVSSITAIDFFLSRADQELIATAKPLLPRQEIVTENIK